MSRHSIRLLDTKSGRAQTRGFHPTADGALARWLDTRKALGVSGRAARGGSIYARESPGGELELIKFF